jgi:16S rRNA processing protein RimM
MGRVLGAHGLRGWLKIQSHTEPPENLLQYRLWTLSDADGSRTSYELVDAEFDGRWLRARLQGVEDRDAAELLRGRDIEVARAELPPTAAREYYRDDLLGFRVRNRAGTELGQLSHYVDAPAAPVMVIRGTREHWVPATPPHLVRVDLEQGEIEVDWPEEL